MSDLTNNVRYDRTNDQIRIEGPVTTTTNELFRHLRDQGLKQEKIVSIFGGQQGGQVSERPQNQGGGRT